MGKIREVGIFFGCCLAGVGLWAGERYEKRLMERECGIKHIGFIRRNSFLWIKATLSLLPKPFSQLFWVIHTPDDLKFGSFRIVIKDVWRKLWKR